MLTEALARLLTRRRFLAATGAVVGTVAIQQIAYAGPTKRKTLTDRGTAADRLAAVDPNAPDDTYALLY